MTVLKFPPNEMTPKGILEAGLEVVDEIEAIGVVIYWKDKKITAGWSQCDTAVLSFMRTVFEHKTIKEICSQEKP